MSLLDEAKRIGQDYEELECSYQTFGDLADELGHKLNTGKGSSGGLEIHITVMLSIQGKPPYEEIRIAPTFIREPGFWPRGRRLG